MLCSRASACYLPAMTRILRVPMSKTFCKLDTSDREVFEMQSLPVIFAIFYEVTLDAV